MCYRNIKVNQTKSNMVLCFYWGTLPTFKYSCWFAVPVHFQELLWKPLTCCNTLFFRALVLTVGLNQYVQSHKEEQSTERQAGQLFCSKCFWLISCFFFLFFFTVII